MFSVIKRVSDRANNIHPVYIAIALFLGTALIAILDMGSTNICCDMAEYINNPLRIIQGDLPYKDFWLLFPPGEVYFPALIYKVFGVNTDILRIATLLSTSLISVVAFYIGMLLFNKNVISALFSLMVFYTSVAYHYEGPEYLHVYFLLLLLSALFLIKYIYTGSNQLLITAGIFSGLALTFRLYESAGAVAGFAIALGIYEYIKHNKNIKTILKSSSFFAVGILIILSAFFIVFNSIALKMINELIVESLKNGTSMNLPYFYQCNLIIDSIINDLRLLGDGFSISKVIFLVYHLLKLPVALLYYILPFISIIYLIRIFKSGAGANNIGITLILMLWGLLSFPKGVGRSDLAHLAPSVTPLIMSLLFIYKNIWQKSIRVHKLYSLSILLIILTMSTTFFYPLFDIVNGIIKPHHTVNTHNGSVPFSNEKDAKDFEGMIGYILENTEENDFIFVTTWDSPPIYALTGRKNPTYYDSLNDLIIRSSEENQNDLINQLEKSKVKYIIHNADWGYDNKPEQQFRTACSTLQNYIENRWKPVAEFGYYTIYQVKVR